MTTQTLIFHNLTQALAAGDVAETNGVRLELRSPPAGAANLGPGVFQKIANEVEQTHPGAISAMILDCGADAGSAMAALRQGCRDICVDVPDVVHKKLAAMAVALTGHLHDQASEALDLGSIQISDGNDLRSLKLAINNYLDKEPAND